MRSLPRRRAIAPLLALGVLAAGASAQLVTQCPRPTGRSLGGVAFTSPTHGFIVGQNHHLLETSDAGVTWTTRMGTALGSDPFFTIIFPDATHGYVAGNNQDAYRTTDAGATWTRMTSMLAGSVRALDFITPTTGFAGYNGAMTWTPDGGVTWQLRSGYPHSPIVFGMDFRDDQVGLAAGIRSTPYNDGGLYRTGDGGRTWAFVHTGYVNVVLWLDDANALAVSGTDVIRSSDAGLTWQIASYGALPDGLGDIARAGGTSVLAGVTANGSIWLSTDLGYSWYRVVAGIGVLPADWAVSFFDTQNGWVVGDLGLTYRTTDAGATWQLLNHGCGDQMRGLEFDDAMGLGVAVTERGFVFRTRDRGANWDTRRLMETGVVWGRDEGLRAVDVIDGSTIVAGGVGGVFFRSEDGGENWFSLGYPYSLPGTQIIEAVHFTDRWRGWIGGSGDASLYRTSDGGYSWTAVPEVIGSIVAIDAEEAMVWACTGGDVVRRSADNGQTWSSIALPGDVSYLTDLEFVDPDIGWAVGWYGYMAKTTDGGATWAQVVQPQSEVYFDVAMIGASEIWVVGYDQSIYRYFYKRSINAGVTWTRTMLSQYEESFTDLHVRPAGRFWLGGSFGKVLYSAPAPLEITLPSGVPPQVPPGLRHDLPVRIVAGGQEIEPGSEALWFRRASAAAFEAIPLVHVAGDAYLAPIPPLRCGDTPQFYFSARGTDGAVVRLPANAPTGFYTTRVGVIQTGDLLNENFDAGLPAGWTATGAWHVGVACPPPGTCGSGSRAYFGFDATCTFNNGLRVQGTLASPQITLPTLQAGQTIVVSFCSALDTEYPDGAYGDDDQAQLWWVSGGQQAPVNWFTDHRSFRTQAFSLDLYAGRTGRLEWRFDSMNTYLNSFRGWHVDNVRVTGPTLACADPCPADLDGDGFVTGDDFILFVTWFENGDLRADLDRDGFLTGDDFILFVTAFEVGC